MRLYEICREAEALGLADLEVSGVTDDTREFKAANVFVCIKGEHFDGHSVAREMLSKGAAAVVVERDLSLEKQIIVDNTRKAYARLASAFYGEPTKSLKIVAVTGTNGKSTVTALIKHIIEKQGHKCGSLGTVGYDTAGGFYEAKLTVPRQGELYRLLAETVANGAKYCVLEASSQALSQDRFADENFDCAVFTNLTQDHLDWHGSMESYYLSKRSLFDMAKSATVCIDDKYGQKLVKYIESKGLPLITYSAKELAQNYAVNVKSGSAGVSYRLSSADEEKSFPVKLPLPGLYNVANSIAAVSACIKLGIEIEDAVEALSDFKGVKGRSEVLHDGEFTVIRDYAHTPDALVKFLSEVQGFVPKQDGISTIDVLNRVICVFGAPGERDVKKRPLMGEAADKHSDYIFVTSDNPRFEDPKTIIDDVCAGIKHTPYETFIKREEAIKAAIKMARAGDIVVLCGKGHESYQVIGDEHQPFDEREIVEEIIRNS